MKYALLVYFGSVALLEVEVRDGGLQVRATLRAFVVLPLHSKTVLADPESSTLRVSAPGTLRRRFHPHQPVNFLVDQRGSMFSYVDTLNRCASLCLYSSGDHSQRLTDFDLQFQSFSRPWRPRCIA